MDVLCICMFECVSSRCIRVGILCMYSSVYSAYVFEPVLEHVFSICIRRTGILQDGVQDLVLSLVGRVASPPASLEGFCFIRISTQEHGERLIVPLGEEKLSS